MGLIHVLNPLGFVWVKDFTELYYRQDTNDSTNLHRSASVLIDVLICRELSLRVFEYKTTVPGLSIRSLHGNSGKPLHEKPFTRVRQLKDLVEQTIVMELAHLYKEEPKDDQCSNHLGHFEDNQGYCHCCGILMNPEQALLMGYISHD